MANRQRPSWREKWDQRTVSQEHMSAGAVIILLAVCVAPTVGWFTAAIAGAIAGSFVDRHFGC